MEFNASFIFLPDPAHLEDVHTWNGRYATSLRLWLPARNIRFEDCAY
jgi:hypothetical protein